MFLSRAKSWNARRFNREIMPTMGDSGYRAVRRTINGHRFPGHVWHVGHACPDPSKESTSNDEDFGWNLFAQHAVDNLKLGHCLVSCAEAEHIGSRPLHAQRSLCDNLRYRFLVAILIRHHPPMNMTESVSPAITTAPGLAFTVALMLWV